MARAAKKPVASTRKRAGRKPQANKIIDSAVKRVRSLETPSRKRAIDKLADSARDVAHVQLGLCNSAYGEIKNVAHAHLGLAGKTYDVINERIDVVRTQAPRKWNALVKRGEQVRRDLEIAGKDLRKDLQARVESMEVPAPISERIDQVRSTVEKLRKRVSNAA